MTARKRRHRYSAQTASVGLVDAYLAAGKALRNAKGQYDKAAGDRFHELHARIFTRRARA